MCFRLPFSHSAGSYAVGFYQLFPCQEAFSAGTYLSGICATLQLFFKSSCMEFLNITRVKILVFSLKWLDNFSMCCFYSSFDRAIEAWRQFHCDLNDLSQWITEAEGLLADARGPDGSLDLQTAGLHQQVCVICAVMGQARKSRFLSKIIGFFIWVMYEAASNVTFICSLK